MPTLDDLARECAEKIDATYIGTIADQPDALNDLAAFARRYAAQRLREAGEYAGTLADRAGENAREARAADNEVMGYSQEERRVAYRKVQRDLRALADKEENDAE